MEDKKTMELATQWGSTVEVKLEINNYMNNNGLYLGLMGREEDDFEPYGDISVNLGTKAPDYCAYVDLNNIPELEKFIEENDLGEFTGLTQRSGFCEYPLYMFNVDKLRELCPDEMATYEANIGIAKKPEPKEMNR